MKPVDLARSAVRDASRFFSVAALSLAVLLSANPAALAAQNGAIAISDNNTHIDRGTAYSSSPFLSASGGTAPYTFSVDPSTPPPVGITINPDGSVSGMTCGSNGNFKMTVTATDAVGDFNTDPNESLIVNLAPSGACTLTFNQTTLPGGNVNTPYSQTLTVSGAFGSVAYTRTGGALPAGLTLSSSGTISGTPTTAGPSTFTVLATDSSGATGSQSFTITISAPSLILSPASLPNGTTGIAYNQTVTASGGTGSYTFAVTSGALPTGLSLSSAGAITGTPSAGGPFSFTIQATDSSSNTGSKSYTVNVGSNSLTVSPASLPNGFTGTAYNQTLTASGGSGSYTFAVTSGALPMGLSLSSAGAITGTPSAGGPFSFTIQATDSGANTGSKSYTVTIGSNLLTVNPASLPNGFTGTAYNQTVTASGGTGSYTFAVTSGALPTGLSLSSAGAITGTPSAGGPFSFTIQATDSGANTGSKSYTVTIGSNSLTLSPASLPNGFTGTAYNQTVTASGGSGSYTFAVTSGALPTGLSLSSAGAITGTPSAGGPFTFTVQATDGGANTGSKSYTVTIGSNSLTVSPASLPNGFTGTAYNQTVTASGGSGPYTFAIASGALPTGLSLSNAGAITGTPTTSGPFSFTIQTTDSSSNTGSKSYTVTIGSNSLTLNPASLPNGFTGTVYSQTLTASGGTGPYTFAITSGALPTGLSLSSAGAITGTASAGGPFSFTIQATDGGANTGTKSYTVTIGSNSLTVSPASLPNGFTGTAYNQTVTASGGSGPYTFAIASGALPTGLSLSNAGAITGTPTTSGPFSFTIQTTDSSSNTGSKSYTVTIGSNSLTLNPASLPNGFTGTVYSQTLTASGGTGPYTFAITSGALPSGLSLSSAGAITGTPTAGGPFSFTVQATDGSANTGSRQYTFNVGNALSLNPANLPNGTQGNAYAQTLTASGGTGPYVFSITSGALPAGLSLSSAGAITGTPGASGAFSFTVQASDGSANIGSRSFSLNVGSNSLALNPSGLPNGTAGTAYAQTLTASGGTGPYSFAVTSGALPAGLSLSSTGAITGTPSAGGSFTVTVQVSDGNANTGSRSFSFNVGTNSLTLNPTVLSNGTQGNAYSQAVNVGGGSGPVTFALLSGTLPAGLSLNASTGVISGTPAGSGASSFTVQATDGAGNTGSKTFTVNIGAASLLLNPASLPAGTRGTPYSQAVGASGGTGPYSYIVSAGALPAGLALNSSTGVISGTPSGSGSSSFSIRATDTLGNIGTRGFAVNIGTASLTINPATLPASVAGRPYSATIAAGGGAAPYLYSVSSGALPPGLTLNAATGVISGTVTAHGSWPFTIQARDGSGTPAAAPTRWPAGPTRRWIRKRPAWSMRRSARRGVLRRPRSTMSGGIWKACTTASIRARPASASSCRGPPSSAACPMPRTIHLKPLSAFPIDRPAPPRRRLARRVLRNAKHRDMRSGFPAPCSSEPSRPTASAAAADSPPPASPPASTGAPPTI
jgi:hypothetical protein